MLKNTHIWLFSYLAQCMKRELGVLNEKPSHVIFSLVDHFEPKRANPSKSIEDLRVQEWLRRYPQVALKHKDSDGNHPVHTFFYPQEEYEKRHLDKLALLCKQGLAEVEVHLHHDNDTAEGLKQKLEGFKQRLLSHNLLARDEKGRANYGFIHGNWALDNSRRDGKCCGVNNELRVLRDTGCYADFTLPSAPSDTQTKKINSIYYAKGTSSPKSHNSGIDVEIGKSPGDTDLMIIQGPLTLNWKRRKFGIFPRIENGEVSLNNSPTSERIGLWVDQRISVKGKPDWIFVKVYTHGAKDENLSDDYFGNLDAMFSYLEEKYNNRNNFKLHYVTAREMYNIIKAAEAGEKGEPDNYRDYLLKLNEKISASLAGITKT